MMRAGCPVSSTSFSTSMPSFSGMIMSIMATSGLNARNASVALSGSLTTWTSNPESVPMRAYAFARPASSSTINSFLIETLLPGAPTGCGMLEPPHSRRSDNHTTLKRCKRKTSHRDGQTCVAGLPDPLAAPRIGWYGVRPRPVCLVFTWTIHARAEHLAAGKCVGCRAPVVGHRLFGHRLLGAKVRDRFKSGACLRLRAGSTARPARHPTGRLPRRALLRRQRAVGLLEQLPRLGHVVWTLAQRLGVPLAAFLPQEVPAIGVDGAAQARNGVDDGVDDVRAERATIAHAQRPCACRLDVPGGILGQPAPEDVVLTAGIDADHRPHPMIMRHDRHARPPHQVDDGQCRGIVQHVEPGALWRPQRGKHWPGIAHRAGHHLSHALMAGIGTRRSLAIGEKAIDVERHSSPPPNI